MAIAEVVVNIVHSDVDRLFDYKIPSSLSSVTVGVEVLIPFGHRLLTGFVVGLKETSELQENRLRDIKAVLHDGLILLNRDLISLAKRMAQYYLVPLAMALDCVVPGGLRGLGRKVSISRQQIISLSPEFAKGYGNLSIRGRKQIEIVKLLEQHGTLEIKKLRNAANLKTDSPLKALINKNIVIKQYQEVFRSPLSDKTITSQAVGKLKLNLYQAAAVDTICQSLINNRYQSFLLHGVTGSGKTEVYIRCIEKGIAQGKQAIMLVPEITLTPQTIDRLTQNFGSSIAVLHSSLSQGERFDEWRRIASGRVKVVVGARSAIFAPLAEIGVIIIDEEHEANYKQQDHLRYDTRQIAEWRAQMHQAVVVSGSATPAVTSYYRALTGRTKLLVLPDRITANSLPEVNIVDMRQELKSGNTAIFSRALQRELGSRVQEKGEKAIILLNRRGHARYLQCAACGDVPQCPNCNVSLTYHSFDRALKCHYCGVRLPAGKTCLVCQSPNLKLMGSGTQQVELFLKKLLPNVDIIRMDSDTTQHKNAHYHLLERFCRAKTAILLGTQMIAKGLDIPEITLVGVVDADTGLNLPDYRADERTFQLLTQVAGRSGRGKIPGQVIIQTYSPQHYSIVNACRHDYLGFYQSEIKYRQQYLYPPFKLLIRVVCAHEEERIARRGVLFISRQLQQAGGEYTVLNPSPAPLNRINNLFRWHIMIKYSAEYAVHDTLLQIVSDLRKRSTKIERPLKVIIDIDPENII